MVISETNEINLKLQTIVTIETDNLTKYYILHTHAHMNIQIHIS